MKKLTGIGSVYEYTTGEKQFPKEYGNLDITREKSKTDIHYLNWKLTFHNSYGAKRAIEECNGEVQIFFCLSQPVHWVYRKAGDEEIQTVDMQVGDACIYYNCQAETSMTYSPEVQFQFKSLHLSTERFESLLQQYFSPEDYKTITGLVYNGPQVLAATPEMYSILGELDHGEKYHNYKDVILDAKMVDLVLLMLCELQDEKKAHTPRMAKLDPIDLEAIRSLHDEIMDAPANSYDAPELAARMNMSVSKLNRIFRRLYNTSLHAYVVDQRLYHARMLLEQGGFAVSEAALQSGYNHFSHFARAFAKKYGMTPKKFLEQQT